MPQVKLSPKHSTTPEVSSAEEAARDEETTLLNDAAAACDNGAEAADTAGIPCMAMGDAGRADKRNGEVALKACEACVVDAATVVEDFATECGRLAVITGDKQVVDNVDVGTLCAAMAQELANTVVDCCPAHTAAEVKGTAVLDNRIALCNGRGAGTPERTAFVDVSALEATADVDDAVVPTTFGCGAATEYATMPPAIGGAATLDVTMPEPMVLPAATVLADTTEAAGATAEPGADLDTIAGAVAKVDTCTPDIAAATTAAEIEEPASVAGMVKE